MEDDLEEEVIPVKKTQAPKNQFIDDTDSDTDDELNAFFVDYEQSQNDTELEVESQRVQYSAIMSGESVETILNMREWLKSPWQEDV